MIKLEKTNIYGWEAAIRGMRNPMNSWDKSDSIFVDVDGEYHDIMGNQGPAYGEGVIGPNDLKLMKSLAKAGTSHSKYRRNITVTLDITAPLYWWKEFDTYKVGTVTNSCSTMHKIHAKEFELDDFSHENLTDSAVEYCLEPTIGFLNTARNMYVEKKSKAAWWQMIQLLPSSYNQKRTVQLNYEVLANIYATRKDHKLDEWRNFCEWIRTLPYSYDLIIVEE